MTDSEIFSNYDRIFNGREEEKVVCFFDVLGAKSFFLNGSLEQKNVLIYELYCVKNENPDYKNINIVVLSDSVYMYCDKENISYLMDCIAVLSYRLLLCEEGVNSDITQNNEQSTKDKSLKILARGGITFGRIVINEATDDYIVFGPAVVRAYEIESNLAIYPRLIFDDEITELILISDKSSFENTVMETEMRGWYYFDWIEYMKNTKSCSVDKERYGNISAYLREKEQERDIRIAAKYKWFLKNMWKEK